MTSLDFPFFDGHMHFSQAYLDEVLASYDECGVQGGLNLWEPHFPDYAGFLKICDKRGLFKRFAQFYWPDWQLFGWQGNAFVRRLCRDMVRYADLGATGLKVWKDTGMFNFNEDGTPVVMDDPRLEPVWQIATELKWTIAIHQADPSRSFDRLSRAKIAREELFERRDRVIAAHPEIRFILCHSGNDIENWDRFAAHLDRFPNVNADLRWPSNFEAPAGKEKAFLENYAERLYIGPDLVMPANRPPDRPWNLNECYRPKRESLTGFGLSKKAFEAITWKNGARDFLK